MQQQVYHSSEIQAWEQRWFQHKNSAYGLMCQVAWAISQHLEKIFMDQNIQRIAVCCGQGNNAGDGYLTAKYLHQMGFDVDIYAAPLGSSTDLQLAHHEALLAGVCVVDGFAFEHPYDAYIDALFGIGLNRQLDAQWQSVVQLINQQQGLKISIDLPSGLQANTGQPLPEAVYADYTFTALGLKAGLMTGRGKAYAGQVSLIDLIPKDESLKPLAYISPTQLHLPVRQASGHKGSYGHVLVVGGHADMGGAAILAGEAAFAAGAGKVTLVCDARHHMAVLARSPNIMLRDINRLTEQDIDTLLGQVDGVCLGMGLGRDEWAERQYHVWMGCIEQHDLDVVLDADALWFLAKYPVQQVSKRTYLTPHPGEAATLLHISTAEVECDRIDAIYHLHEVYGGHWVLKGSGSLILENEQLWMCVAGNPGMGTGGMGDVLAGMLVSLKAQFRQGIELHQIVTLHALSGDLLAQKGQRGLQAQDMKHAIYQVVNQTAG